MAQTAHSGRPGPRHGKANFRIETDGDGVSYAARQFVQYPFHVTRLFHMDEAWPELATLYLQSVSGGLFAEDDVGLGVEVADGAAFHVTSQSATKVHTMVEGSARQTARLTVEPGGYLEYLFDPVILFPDARLHSSVDLLCAEDSTAIVGDSLLSHNPAGGDTPAFASFATEVAIRRPDGSLLALDRFRIDDPANTFGNPGLDGGCIAQGTVYVVSGVCPPEELAESLRAAVAGKAGVRTGASILPGECGAWLRVLADEGENLRRTLHAAWAAARQMTAGKPMGRARK